MNIKTKKTLAAIFAGAAMAMAAGSVCATVLGDFFQQQIQSGTRGIVVGESHANVTLPHGVTEALKEFKAAGGTTIYCEYVSAVDQAVLDRALNGSEPDQKDLRAAFEYGWGSSHTSAQARYDELMEAHKLGLRVIAVDIPMSDLHTDHAFSATAAPIAPQRLLVADPYITDVIRQSNDGKPFLLLIGGAHIYAAHNREKMDDIDSIVWHSDEGGVNARLAAGGIPTVAVEMLYKSHGAWAVSEKHGITADYRVLVPEDPDFVGEDNALVLRGRTIGLMKKFQSMARSSAGPAKENATNALEATAALKDALFKCGDQSEIMERIHEVMDLASKVANDIPSGNEHRMLVYLPLKITGIVDTPERRADVMEQNNRLCQPEARTMWEGPQ
jgi:hypothetical protein